jgi:hypothetical protein
MVSIARGCVLAPRTAPGPCLGQVRAAALTAITFHVAATVQPLVSKRDAACLMMSGVSLTVNNSVYQMALMLWLDRVI